MEIEGGNLLQYGDEGWKMIESQQRNRLLETKAREEEVEEEAGQGPKDRKQERSKPIITFWNAVNLLNFTRQSIVLEQLW